MNFPIVKLRKEEMEEAKRIGEQRQNVHDAVGRYDNKVLSDGKNVHVQGAIGELVVSKYLELQWDGKFKDNEEWLTWRKEGHDVSGLEVRFTKHKNGRLIIHDKDKNRSIFVLVVEIDKYTYQIGGWCFGFEGKRPNYWQDVGYGRPCYFVPREKMRSISIIKDKKINLEGIIK